MSIGKKGYLIGRNEINVGALTKEVTQKESIIISQDVEHLGYNGRIDVLKTIEYPRTLYVRKCAFEGLKNGLSKDSLYTSARYEIDGVDTEATHCDNFQIKHSSNIGELLRLLNYGESLSGNQLYRFMQKLDDPFYFFRIINLCGYKKVDGKLMYHGSDDRVGEAVFETLSRIRSLPIKPFPAEPGYDKIKRRR